VESYDFPVEKHEFPYFLKNIELNDVEGNVELSNVEFCNVS
jgi:hypothetical protein